MHNVSLPQLLTLSCVKTHDEIWHSDSDSGITVGSYSNSDTTSPGSAGLHDQQLSWSVAQPHYIPMDDVAMHTMDKKDIAPSVLSPKCDERKNQQEHLRNKLFEYEQQEELREEHRAAYFQGPDSRLAHHPPNGDQSLKHFHSHYDQHAEYEVTEDYQSNLATSRNRQFIGTNLVHSAHALASGRVKAEHERRLQSADSCIPDSEYMQYSPMRSKGDFLEGEYLPSDLCFASPADDGYGTDSRSNTTISLSSPLSSSLSSLTTDSSSSLNGSQRGVSIHACSASARGQPVPGSGRLVVGRRAMLVKRRDLPPVERTDSLTLEDRLRALTTIEEEDGGLGINSGRKPTLNDKISGTTLGNQRVRDTVHNEGQLEAEGLYSLINKGRGASNRLNGSGTKAHLPLRGPSLRKDKALLTPSNGHVTLSNQDSPQTDFSQTVLEKHIPGSENAIFSNSEGCYRGVSVFMDGNGNKHCLPRDVNVGDEKVISTRVTHDERVGIGGGVKMNDSGEIEIDYSYYLKATPSESNDKLNTYTPKPNTTDRCDASADTLDFAADGNASVSGKRVADRRRDTFLAEEDQSRLLAVKPVLHTVQNFNFSVHLDRHNLTIQPRDSGALRQTGAMSSMPNLSIHSGRAAPQSTACEPFAPHEEDNAIPVLRRTSALSCVPGQRRPGPGDRNSCDVGSLYRQSDLNSMQPVAGNATERLSLNLADLPRIQEQLRATSEMFLATAPTRHQFASSSDIYKLFQGQQNPSASLGLHQARTSPLQRSIRAIPASASSPHLAQNFSDTKSCTWSNIVTSSGRISQVNHFGNMASPVLAGGSSRLSAQTPLLGNLSTAVHDHKTCFSSSGRDGDLRESCLAKSRNGYFSAEGEAKRLRDSLARGQQFATDVIQDENGGRLSTLV